MIGSHNKHFKLHNTNWWLVTIVVQPVSTKYTQNAFISIVFGFGAIRDSQQSCKNRIIYVIQPLMEIESKTHQNYAMQRYRTRHSKFLSVDRYPFVSKPIILFMGNNPNENDLMHTPDISIYTKYTEFQCLMFCVLCLLRQNM